VLSVLANTTPARFKSADPHDHQGRHPLLDPAEMPRLLLPSAERGQGMPHHDMRAVAVQAWKRSFPWSRTRMRKTLPPQG
jgi:hypothetical protein